MFNPAVKALLITFTENYFVILVFDFFKLNNSFIINAYIKNNNISSKIIFEKAGFRFLENILFNNFNTDHYVLYADRKL